MNQSTDSLPTEAQDVREGATHAPPVVWLLGPAGSGQTSLLAELTRTWRAVLRHELTGATSTAEIFPYPAEQPRLRFLLTVGLQLGMAYDPAEDIACAQRPLGLLLVTVRAGDLQVGPLLGVLRQVRAAHPDWPVLVAQTRLHEYYPAGRQHPMPYAYDQDGLPNAAVPEALALALQQQRDLLADIAGPHTRFVPIDLTEPRQGQAVMDYGAAELHRAIDLLAPEVARRLAAQADPEHHIRARVILPWAAAAAATDAPPLPILGGLPAVAMQAAMVRAIARRFDVASDATIWAGLLGVLGTGFLLRYAVGWMVRQVLKLAPFWGGAAVATWTFAVTCGIGEAAIRFCREEAEGRVATPEAIRAAFRQGSTMRGAGQGGAPF